MYRRSTEEHITARSDATSRKILVKERITRARAKWRQI